MIFTALTRNQVDNITVVARQIASDITKPTSNFILKLISYQIIFAGVTFLIGCHTTSTILTFGREQEEGEKFPTGIFSSVQGYDGVRWENYLHIFISVQY